jgi:hypothetical protein
MTELEGEGVQMPYVHRARGQKPVSYTKFDIIDLAPHMEEYKMTQTEFFEYNVLVHLKDMKSV